MKTVASEYKYEALFPRILVLRHPTRLSPTMLKAKARFLHRLPREVAAQMVPCQNGRTLRRSAAKQRSEIVHNLQALFDAMSELDQLGC